MAMAPTCMALTKPRQALPRSKFTHVGARPSRWCTEQATLGSRWCLQTEVEISRSTSEASTPAQLMAPAPGERGRLVEGDPLGPPPALDDAGHRLEQSGTDAAALEGLGQLLVDPRRGDDLGGLGVSEAPD